MSYEKVKKFLEDNDILDHLSVHNEIGDTVEHAALILGCVPGMIAKTMTFNLTDQIIAIVMAGDAKIDNAKYKAYFHQKAHMVPYDQVEALVGYIPGGVCPFALNDGVKVYLDVSLKSYKYLHTSGGSLNTTIALTIEELEKYSQPVAWIDIAKSWQKTEDERNGSNSI